MVGGAAFLALLFWVPRALTAPLELSPLARLTLENQLRDTAAKVLWAGVTLLGAALVWRYLRALGDVVENSAQTLAAAERTAYFAAQAGETERYARAMALLGDEKIEVRLGGIYALERLARESERDHGPIMEVLSAYVRQHAPWREGVSPAPRPRADLQAILTVVGRRHAPFDPSEGHIDWHGTALARAYLPHAHLEKAFLYEANLEGALLQDANLRGAWLWKADLTGAVLQGAHLEGADLTGVAGLTPEQIQSVHSDKTTKWPEYLRGEVEIAPQQAPVAPNAAAQNPDNLKLPTRR